MVKKTTKKSATIKKTSTNKKDSSTTIMILTAVGLVLLIYFGSNVSVDANIEINTPNNIEKLENTFILNGKSYSSETEAMEKLKSLPQTLMSDEERLFIKRYKE